MAFLNSFTWLAIGWHLHMTFVAIALIGGILIAIWAVKNLQKNKLRSFAIWLVVIGIIGFMITVSVGTRGWTYMMSGSNFPLMNMMLEDHEDIETPDDFREHMLEEMSENMGFGQ